MDQSETNESIESKESDSSASLLDRKPEAGYIKEWTESLRQPFQVGDAVETISVIVFRLGNEWLALPTIYLKEVMPRRPFHRIPHRSNKILLGIVNLNGELKIYVALHELLQIEMLLDPTSNRSSYQSNRMMVAVKEGEFWIFPVDEVDGIYQWNLLEMENVPVNVSKSLTNYVKGIMKMENKNAGLLDEELLFASLKRSVQ